MPNSLYVVPVEQLVQAFVRHRFMFSERAMPFSAAIHADTSEQRAALTEDFVEALKKEGRSPNLVTLKGTPDTTAGEITARVGQVALQGGDSVVLLVNDAARLDTDVLGSLRHFAASGQAGKPVYVLVGDDNDTGNTDYPVSCTISMDM